jgi:hypothetical protein
MSKYKDLTKEEKEIIDLLNVWLKKYKIESIATTYNSVLVDSPLSNNLYRICCKNSKFYIDVEVQDIKELENISIAVFHIDLVTAKQLLIADLSEFECNNDNCVMIHSILIELSILNNEDF